jgi:hypothetical protein
MSIQKRTYERAGRGGRKVKRTVWRVRWLDSDGQHRSKQFDNYADAQAFDGQAKAGGTKSSGATGQLPLAQRSANLVTLGDLWNEWFPVYAKTVAKGTADTNETCWRERHRVSSLMTSCDPRGGGRSSSGTHKLGENS